MPEGSVEFERGAANLKRYLAEFIGAFFLVFVGAGAIIADVYRSKTLVTDSFGLLGIALAHGLALAVVIAAIARISGGHANPAVTLAFWVARRMKAADMAGYIVAQLLGGVVAAFLLKGLMPADAFSNAGAGIPALAEGVQPLKAIAIEGILTFFLTFVIWGVAVDRKGPKVLAPFAIGLTVTFGILAGGTFTGAALNPARWFGPALASGQWGTPLVYIAGPILG
ncbi:MAG TPA: aquaporin, partial [Actinomycetota bacterium]|nr:aquaporin [Actinomycetota bacterium]